MKIPILVERLDNSGFRAKGGEPFAESADGKTAKEAVDKLKQCLQARLDSGAELVALELGAEEHPWLPFAGMFQEDDPSVQKWLDIMKQQREQDELI